MYLQWSRFDNFGLSAQFCSLNKDFLINFVSRNCFIKLRLFLKLGLLILKINFVSKICFIKLRLFLKSGLYCSKDLCFSEHLNTRRNGQKSVKQIYLSQGNEYFFLVKYDFLNCVNIYSRNKLSLLSFLLFSALFIILSNLFLSNLVG